MSFKAHDGAYYAPVVRTCLCGIIGSLLILSASCGAGNVASNASSPPTTPTANPTPTTTTNSSSGPVITVPASSSVTSPVLIGGAPGEVANVDHMRLLLDGNTSIFDSLAAPYANKWIFLPTGQHELSLAAFDAKNNQLAATTMPIDISGQVSPTVMNQLQTLPGWLWCTATRGGQPCASGLGNATSTQIQNQTSPSLSGSSTEFTIAGPKGYSNALWWISLGGGTLLSQFTYEMDFYIDKANVSEALEFDLNQSFEGLRYTWGTECSFLNTHKWDVWDPKGEKWVPTSAPCPQLSSNQWHHLKWQFERVKNQVHYISVSVDSKTYPVNVYLNPEPNWNSSDLNIAFQMDGNSSQTPYNVWLDNVTVTAYY